MKYRFYWKVWLGYSGSWFDDGFQLQLFLDGTQHNVTVKGYQENNYGWSYEGTTEWYTVQNKTSGTTSFYARLYDTSASALKATSSTYSLAVTGAASILGSIGSFDVDSGVKISITKYDSSFADTLVISYGGTNIMTVENVVNGYQMVFRASYLTAVYNAMANVKSGTFTFTLTTRSGGTVIGTSTQTAVGSISGANPTFSASKISYADIEPTVYNITGNDQHIVQNKSNLRVYFTDATGNKGATISQYAVTVNGVTKTATASGYVDFGAVNTSQNTNITIVVKDSRGNTTTATKSITILAYSAPTMAVVLERLNNYEDETYLTVNASVSSVNGKNTMSISYKKKQSGGSYGTSTELSNNTKHTTICDKGQAFVFSVTVTDRFESRTVEYVLPKGRFPMFIDTLKNAVGINEFPNTGESLRVAGGVACFDDGIVLKSASKSFKITIDDSGKLVITELK